jgi:hypothetical protein
LTSKWKYLKIAAISFAVLGLFYLVISFLFNYSRKSYTKEQAIANFTKKEKELDELVQYFRSIKPAGKEVSYGMGKSKQYFHMGVIQTEWEEATSGFPLMVNIRVGSAKADSMLRLVGWETGMIDELRQRLKNVNCTDIFSLDDNITIDHKTGTLSGFAYYYQAAGVDSIDWGPDVDMVTVLRKDVRLLFASVF